jgi:hypothetical protein
LWIYNNVILITNFQFQASDPPQGIAVGPDGGSFSQLGRWPQFNDILIANNLVVDYADHGSTNLRNNPGQGSTFTNCVVANNAIVNGGGIGQLHTVNPCASKGLSPTGW